MEQRISIIGLGVNDLQASTKFYESKFGWTKLDSSNDNITFFELNGLLLSLYPADKLAEDAQVSPIGSGFKKQTLAYNTRSEAEVNDIIQSLSAKGVTIIKQPEKVFWGGYSGYIEDLDGHLWEIAYNPYIQISADGNLQL